MEICDTTGNTRVFSGDSKITYRLGVDPGWSSMGYAILAESANTFKLVESGTLRPRDSEESFTTTFVDNLGHPITSASIERYVPYNNTFSAEAENITMLIGSLRQALRGVLPEGSPPALYRAIDWKTSLVKILVKYYGFDNPSTSLDKKFSVAAAKCLLKLDNLNITDHEADAICLAAFPTLCSWYKVPTAENGKTRTVN